MKMNQPKSSTVIKQHHWEPGPVTAIFNSASEHLATSMWPQDPPSLLTCAGQGHRATVTRRKLALFLRVLYTTNGNSALREADQGLAPIWNAPRDSGCPRMPADPACPRCRPRPSERRQCLTSTGRTGWMPLSAHHQPKHCSDHTWKMLAPLQPIPLGLRHGRGCLWNLLGGRG